MTSNIDQKGVFYSTTTQAKQRSNNSFHLLLSLDSSLLPVCTTNNPKAA